MSYTLPIHCQPSDTLEAPTTRQELWPELNVYYRFNDKFRLFASYSATKLKRSSYTDGGLTLNFDYFALPVWRKAKSRADSARGHLLWLRGGLLYSSAPAGDEREFKEFTIITELSARIYLPFKFLLIHRSRVDWRFLREDFQPRYRTKFQLERDLSTAFLTFNGYAYAEYYINFDGDIHNRLRLAIGSELKVTRHINFEIYYVHQFDNGFGAPTVNAMGLKLKIYWHHGDRLFPKKK